MTKRKIFTVAITGASGAVYAVRLVQELTQGGHHIHLLMSEASWQVFRDELLLDIKDRNQCLEDLFSLSSPDVSIDVHDLQDFQAPVASGSYQMDAMVVIPCSMGTLSKIANGNSGNLLERAADVQLKEKRDLILVPRETPLHGGHLENMLKAERNGAQIVPAMPGFYHLPETKEDLIDFVVGKVLDALGIEHSLFRRWGEEA
ncbi:UbiX family flavin prenyltransferase [Aliibacillus thermotolerans]|uniref:Flavin prenyltransferase UbiX n=1 Tax=Aliibacillus thermotolerans TaxID=1834418 RepID=A0ABW0U6C6_9BACI|nr:UbiX family flavin prenyltransferase [Aliibacillus thermotolerans]MDA3130198.1 UbiX family flavin prenyltransferase [Aliibacillus thermotolerans]